MNKIHYAIAFSLVFVLAACNGFIGNSSDYVTYYLDKGFIGHPSSEFFYIYGNPAGKFDKGNGIVVYRWVSTNLGRHPSKVVVENYTSNANEYEVVDSYRGSIERHYCELRITTDRDDLIRGFDIAVDSTGKWSTSRCSEIFDRVYP